MTVYRAELGLSPRDLAVAFGIYAVGLLPGLLFAGPISDRLGRRRVVVPSALLALVGSMVLGAGAADFPRLLLGRFVVGLGSGATFTAATAWVQDLAASGHARGTGARRAAVALSAGFGGGPLVASVLAQWLPYPQVLPYAVQATVLIVAICLVGLAGDAATASGHLAPTAGPGSPRRSFLPAGFLREVVPVAPWVFGLVSISFAVLPANVQSRVGGWPVLFTGVVTATT